jgi:hypothetical protein
MPHAMLRLVSGVNTTETPALNENSGISFSNLVRYFYDQNGAPLVGKLGGWQKFFPTPMLAIVRALWAWEDINDNAHLALGTEIIPLTSRSQLAVITNGVLADITPVQASSNNSPTIFSTTSSPVINITDPVVPGITNSCSVFIATQIATGGIVLFGLYACDPDGFSGADSYTVYATDILGNLTPATSATGYVLPAFSTTLGSNVITVILTGNGYSVGLTFPILIPTTVGGLTLSGNYIIQTIIDANTFTILSPSPAESTDSENLNGGKPVFVYSGVGSTPPSSAPIAPEDWTLDNFGQDLIACPTTTIGALPLGLDFQPIYIWAPQSQSTATVIPQAPPVNDGVFVAMPQRQIVAWGSTQTGIQDPLLINWSDVNNPNQWIALPTNQAGSYRIPKGSRIVGGVQGPQQAIIWTDIDVWSMQYIGPPYVYSFNEIGTGCGLIGRKAAASMNGIYYWMGPSQFFTLGGDGVVPLPCPVWDVVFQNLYPGLIAANKIRVAINSRFGEIQWFYPSANGTGEIDSYVKYNVYMGVWDYGSLGRTAWVDQSVLGPPIGADPASLYLYQHETSNDADGVAMLPFFQTGYFALNKGDFKTFVDLVWPDMRWGQWSQVQNATVAISFYVLNYPGDTPVVYGPYSVTQATKYFNTRLRGRLVSIRISSSDLGTWWRIGALRYRYAPDGRF